MKYSKVSIYCCHYYYYCYCYYLLKYSKVSVGLYFVMIILRVLLLMTLIIEIRMILIITTFFLLRNFIRRFLLLLIFTYFHVSLFQPIFVVTLFNLGVRVNKSLEILDLSYNQLGKYGCSTYTDSIKLVFYAALCTLILTPTPEPAPTP